MADLRYEFEKWKSVRADMLQGFRELWDDNEALLDTVEGETGLEVEAWTAKVAEEILQAMALAAACKQRADDMAARAARLTRSVESLRGLLIQLFVMADRKTIVTPVATVTLKATPATLLILEEADIPTKYWAASDPILDKKQLKTDLKAGEKIEGAMMSEPGSTIAIKGS